MGMAGFSVIAGGTTSGEPEAEVLYSAGFEVEEGYSAADDMQPLRGQMGWIGEGSGGSGVLTNFFEGLGQQAYVGWFPPALKDTMLSIWRPEIGFTNNGLNAGVLRFSVLMQVVDSANGEYDDFRWSFYNTESKRLFTIDFDNSSAAINYALDDPVGYRPTGFEFRNDVIYQLDVWMNFNRNCWMAMMNGAIIVDSQPMTTLNSRLDLSDVDAVWAIRKKGVPGDNYLLFDNYVLTREPGSTIPPINEVIGLNANGEFEMWVHGERGMRYVIDVTTDLNEWTPLATNAPPDGLWQFVDTSSIPYRQSFYRVREAGY